MRINVLAAYNGRDETLRRHTCSPMNRWIPSVMMVAVVVAAALAAAK